MNETDNMSGGNLTPEEESGLRPRDVSHLPEGASPADAPPVELCDEGPQGPPREVQADTESDAAELTNPVAPAEPVEPPSWPHAPVQNFTEQYDTRPSEPIAEPVDAQGPPQEPPVQPAPGYEWQQGQQAPNAPQQGEQRWQIPPQSFSAPPNQQYGEYPPTQWQAPPQGRGYGGWGNQPPRGYYGQQPMQPPPPAQYRGQGDAYNWNFHDYSGATGHSVQPPRKKGRRKALIAICVVAALGVLTLSVLGIISALTVAEPDEVPGEASSIGLQINDKPGGGQEQVLEGGKLTTAQVAKKVGPSVVGIANYQNGQSFMAANEGSGIIMTEDGYILTNAHVVEGALGLTVTLYDGETYSATLVGMDTKTDLAVVKIDAKGLTFAEFGNSNELEVGEDVVAIGNPAGAQLAGSVTKGIVSALNRGLGRSSYETSYIQTDAAINPGNSGGALVNEYGQVVGINSAKLVATDYEGIGFAIPISDALPVVEQLIAHGRVTGRAELGLTGQMVDETIAAFNQTPMGIGVVSVRSDSDLARKGVVPGDIITKVDGEQIYSFATLTDVIAKKKPGDTVDLTVFRRGVNGGNRTFEVTVALMEEQ